MLMVRRRGGAAEEIEPVLCCQVCHCIMSLQEAWLAFAAISPKVPQSPVIWLHKDCVSGNAAMLFDSQRVTLWRAVDCFNRLMRATEAAR